MSNLIIRLTVLGAVVLQGCKNNPKETKIMYMPDMADTPVVKPHREYLDPPDGSVAVSAILYTATAEETEKEFSNIFSTTSRFKDQHLEDGKKMWDTFCTVCHGPDAKGEGSVVDKFPRPPDLTLDIYKDRKDGFFFHRITFGSAIMPSYGHAISPHERWQLILYLRTLQNGGE